MFGRPGEFVRPYLIARKEQVPVTSQFAAWVLERMFDLLMALLLFGFALDPGAVVRPACGSEAILGAGRGRKSRWTLGAAILLVLLSLRHFAEPCGSACWAPSTTCPRSDSRDLRKP